MSQWKKVICGVMVGASLFMYATGGAQAQTAPRGQAYAVNCLANMRGIANTTIITSAGRKYFHYAQTCGYMDGLGGPADHPTFFPVILSTDGDVVSITVEGFVQYQTTGPITPFAITQAGGWLTHTVGGKPLPGVLVANQPNMQMDLLISIAQP